MQRTVVLGGGVAGLTAAIHLAERGLRPILLEAHPHWIGGRLRGGPAVEINHGGRCWSFPGEHGVHGIWSGYRNLLALLARHAILPDLVPAREETWIFGRGAYIRKAPIGSAIRSSPVPAPFHYVYLLLRPRFLTILTLRDIITLPRVMGSFLGVLCIDPLIEQKSLAGMSLADFTASWSPMMRSFFAGLSRNALSAHPEEIPVSGFIAFLRFYTLLRRDSWAFSYLPGDGGSCIAEPLAGVARRLGCDLRLGSRAVRLERQHGCWRVLYVAHPDGALQACEAESIIMALDAPAAQKLLVESPATAEAAAALQFPRGMPTAVVRLWFGSRPRRTTEAGIFSGDFLMDNFFWLDRLQPAYADWSAATGGSAVEMHIYGPPEVLDQPDAALLAQVIQHMYRAFPELRGQLLRSVLLRNEATHTLFQVGESGRHLAVETPWPGLFACGDWVYYPHPALYLERAAVTGCAAAGALLTSLGLEPCPILPSPQPEWLAHRLSAALWRLRQIMLRRKRR